LPRGHRNKS